MPVRFDEAALGYVRRPSSAIQPHVDPDGTGSGLLGRNGERKIAFR